MANKTNRVEWPKLKPKVKKAWLAALRSGFYKQGREELRREVGNSARYCCMGVLCDLGKFRNSRWVEVDSAKRGRVYSYACDDGYAINTGFPPDHVMQAAGLDRGVSHHLALLNDIGMSFEAIADWIDENL